MIQRVQSIYLLVVCILMSFLVIMPYANMVMPGNQSLLFKATTIYLISPTDIISVYKPTIAVILLALITGMFSFCIIFFYNHRILQIRLILVNLLLIIILIAIMVYNVIDSKGDFDGGRLTFKIAMVFPIVSLVFSFLAIRGIRHDEMLVNSYNRIR